LVPSASVKTNASSQLLEAFEIAKKFAESPQGWLVFYGPYGCGKTHLAAAIGNYQAGLGYPPLFVGVPDLLDYLRAAYPLAHSGRHRHRIGYPLGT